MNAALRLLTIALILWAPRDLCARQISTVVQAVRVPPLLGRSLNEADRLLEQTRLRRGRVDSAPSAAKPGTVIGQTPPADSVVRIGIQVDLVLATPLPAGVDTPPKPVPVPDVPRPVPHVPKPPSRTPVEPNPIGRTPLWPPIAVGTVLLVLLGAGTVRTARHRRVDREWRNRMTLVSRPDPGRRQLPDLTNPLAGPELNLVAKSDPGQARLASDSNLIQDDPT